MKCLKFECPHFAQSEFYVSYGECTLDSNIPRIHMKIDSDIPCFLEHIIKEKEESLNWYKDRQTEIILKQNSTYIQRFYDVIKNQYPNAKLKYDYDNEDDLYCFEHFNIDLDRDEDFSRFVGEQLKILFDNNIFNISFSLSMTVFDEQ